MFIIVIEVSVCVFLITGVILALFLCNKSDQAKFSSERTEKLEFGPPNTDEQLLVQHALVAYYEQREELMARQKVLADTSLLNKTQFLNNESGYTSIPSTAHTPRSLYECTGFASMENLEVTNPLFMSDLDTLSTPSKWPKT